MPSVVTSHLIDSLGLEGSVTLWRAKDGNAYLVIFRIAGRQIRRTTGCANLSEAKKRGAEIFAEAVRGPKESLLVEKHAAELSDLKREIADLAALVRTAIGTGKHSAILSARDPSFKPKQLSEALSEFLKFKKDVKKNALATLNRDTRRLKSFEKFLGANFQLKEITTEHLESFAKRKDGNGERTGENDLDVVCTFLRWSAHPKRRWCTSDAVDYLEVSSVKGKGGPISILTLDQAKRIMPWLEANAPDYALFYALALFGGLRASKDIRGGSELLRLEAAVKREGWENWWKGGENLYAERKTGKTKRCHCPDNLQAWLAVYTKRGPLQVPSQVWHQKNISEAFSIKRNAFRHTACSAFVSAGGDLGRASILFDNSEHILKQNYVNVFEKNDALDFWKIYPVSYTQKVL